MNGLFTSAISLSDLDVQTRYVVIGSAQGEVNTQGKHASVASDGLTYLSIYKNPVRPPLRPGHCSNNTKLTCVAV